MEAAGIEPANDAYRLSQPRGQCRLDVRAGQTTRTRVPHLEGTLVGKEFRGSWTTAREAGRSDS
jgi:hypothetical protein